MGVGVFSLTEAALSEIPMQKMALHKGEEGEESADSWDLVQGHNRCLLDVNIPVH